MTLGQMMGVWVDSPPTATPNPPGAVSWQQLNGVWLTGAPSEITPILDEPVGTFRGKDYLEQARQEDEELLLILRAFIHVIS